MTKIGIKIKLLIVYYLQTDGQIERINQSLETCLHHYINHSQKNWIKLLLMTQLVLNNKKAIIIEKSLYYVNHRRHPNPPTILKQSL